MDRAKKRRNIWLFVGLFASVLGAAAIPGVVFSAIGGQYVAMAFCIVAVADVIYGVPFYWIAFGNAAVDVRTVAAIAEGVDTVEDLSRYLSCPMKEAGRRLARCVLRGYLPGYILRGDRLCRIEKKQPPAFYRSVCDYCGSAFEPEIPDGKCPHCGGILRREKIK